MSEKWRLTLGLPLFSTPQFADKLSVVRNDELGMAQVGNDLLTNKIFVKK